MSFLVYTHNMSYVQYNVNPERRLVGDSVIRAISAVLDQDWDTTFLDIALEGFIMKDMPSSNEVWMSYLSKQGFERYIIPNTCPTCYTVKDFCKDHLHGTYLLATGTHVVAVINGNYFDTWDSGNEIPIFYFRREN